MPIKFVDSVSRVVSGDIPPTLPNTVQVETAISSAILLESRGAKSESELYAPKASRDERINQPVGQLLTVVTEVAGPDGIITTESIGIVQEAGDVALLQTETTLTPEEETIVEEAPAEEFVAETALEETSVFVDDTAAPEQTDILASGNQTEEELPTYATWFDTYWDPNTETLVQALYIWDGVNLQVIV